MLIYFGKAVLNSVYRFANRKFANEQKNLIVYDFLNASFNQSTFDPDYYEKEGKVLNFKYK